MKKEDWVWMPHAAHFICGRDCEFSLATYVGGYIVSTVGEYFPDSQVREIHAKSRGIKLEGIGDARELDYRRKIGYEPIGFERLYETMVFKAGSSTEKCCPFRAVDWTNVDFNGYNEPGDAMKGHLKLCKKWSRKKVS